MVLSSLLFLSSGLFLGWSLGANDVSNIFGAAVGSKMIKFRTAAVIASVFVIAGAVFGGSATTQTLTDLGEVNALAGSFMVALSAALGVYFMAKAGLTTSSSQAIVGAIIGWNLYADKPTDISLLLKIVLSWVLCPIFAAIIAIGLYFALRYVIKKMRLHILRQNEYLRVALVVSGALCTYALGANNIANVMGVFVDTISFEGFKIGALALGQKQILFLLGGIAISAGVFTYAQKVMETIGSHLIKISPFTALVIIVSQALVLFMFTSPCLKHLLSSFGLFSLPLVPVSSTQAVIGAILGIGLLKGGRGVNWSVIGRIVTGWLTTPLIALVVCFIGLFFVENVFRQVVFIP